MKMRHISYIFWILTLLFALPVSAQEMTVKSMVHDPFDQTANLSENMYKDNNLEYGGLVKVRLAVSGATFEGWVLKQEPHGAGEYWVFMAKGSGGLTVKAPGYLPLEVDFSNYDDCIVKSLHTYILTITLPQAAVAGPVDDGMRYLAMTVEPKSSTVFVDGAQQTVDANGEVSVLLPKGTHRYQVSAPGYATKEGSVEVGDDNSPLSVKLVSTQATLRVECATKGAQVFINNQQRGTAPWSGLLASGSYQVEVRLDGYRSQKQTVTLAQSEKRTLTIPELQQITGSLNVDCRPLGSEVYVDGKKVGTTPNIFRDIPVGQRRVEIRKEGYESLTKTVTINENEQASVTGTLKAIVASAPSTPSSPSTPNSPSTSYLSCPDNNHPHMIDLGLPSGTKWACCNVDDNHKKQSPTNYGCYYAWGEVKGKRKYADKDYKYCTYYNYKYHYASLGSDLAGTQYDVAHIQWGGTWQMPSLDQISELCDKCTNQWTTINGVKGRSFTGPNGGVIFLPAAGFNIYKKIDNAGSSGYYWSSSQYPSFSYFAYFLSFDSGSTYWDNRDLRSSGRTVRPVSR